MTGDEHYVDAEYRLDVDAVRADHHADDTGMWCPTCNSDYPCPYAWAADRIERLRVRHKTPAPSGVGEKKESDTC